MVAGNLLGELSKQACLVVAFTTPTGHHAPRDISLGLNV